MDGEIIRRVCASGRKIMGAMAKLTRNKCLSHKAKTCCLQLLGRGKKNDAFLIAHYLMMMSLLKLVCSNPRNATTDLVPLMQIVLKKNT
jgi:hypothetical protein